MPDAAQSAISPTRREKRVQLLDALRGFALFGIILVNIQNFTGGDLIPDQRRAAQFGDAIAWNVDYAVYWLAGGKFYTIFSLLFGIGFAIQIQRLEASGRSIALYVRRLLVLFLFGLANLILVWMVDILALYALVGLVLLLFRNVSDRTLLLWAVLLWIAPIFWMAAIAFLEFRPGAPLRGAAQAVFRSLLGYVPDGPLEVYSQRDYLLLVKLHLGEIFIRLRGFVDSLRPAKVLAMFLMGLWIGRRMIYVRLEEHVRLLKKVMLWGFALGLPASSLAAWLAMTSPDGPATMRDVLQTATQGLGHPTLALAYVAAFALMWLTGARSWLARLAPAGQMALTNYLLHAIILLLVFFGVGFGLIGKVSNAWIPLIAVLLFVAQLSLSRAWLRHFRFGPAEWLWRTLTYGQMQPMRLRPIVSAVPAE